MKVRSAFIAALIMAAAPAAWGHGDAKHPATAKKTLSTEEKAFGREGNPQKAVRTVNIDMSDKMRFTPDTLTIKQGETIKFVIRNSGKTLHEFVLGTMSELKEHSALMQKFPGMEHAEPYMAHVAPVKTETIAWQFTKAGNFHFGCLIPGHFEAGMVGNISVTAGK